MVSLIIFLGVGLLCGLIGGKYMSQRMLASMLTGGRYMDRTTFMMWPILLTLIMVYAAMFLQIIVHEGGHLVFGYISGYDFVSFRIASLILIKTEGGLKLKRFSIAGTGGQCLMSPPDMVDGKIPVMLYNFGGSLLNIIISTLAVSIWVLIRGTGVGTFLLIFALIGYGFAAVNGIPMKMGMVNNDGYNAMNLSKDKTAVRAFWLMLKINALQASGLRLRDMPDEYFALPDKADMSNSLVAGYSPYVFSRCVDMGDFDAAIDAGKFIMDNGAALVPVNMNGLKGELMFLELIGENRDEVISSLYSKELMKALRVSKTQPSALRCVYAYELKRGDKKTAEKYLKLFNKSLEKFPNSGEIEGERELMALVK